ncbi:MAG: hypothetical protein GXO39_04750 [Thermotogae bacterium]|nr:hypothetical protein [Thermotogota bacterium]
MQEEKRTKHVEERLKVSLEYFKLLWILMIAVGSGLVSLFLSGLNDERKVIVFVAGFWLLIVIVLALWKLNLDIKELLNNLEDGGNENE